MSRLEGLGCLEHVREWPGPIEANLLDSQSTASDSETLLFRFDIATGNAAGLGTCGVPWGNKSRKQLVALKPTHVVDEAA